MMKQALRKGLSVLTSAACVLGSAMLATADLPDHASYIKPKAAAVQGQIGYLLGDLDFNNRVDINDISLLFDGYVKNDLLYPDAPRKDKPTDYAHANIDGARTDTSKPVTRREDVNQVDLVFLYTYCTMKMMMPEITWKDVFTYLGRNQFMDYDRGEMRLYYSNYLHDYILIPKQPK